MRRAKIAATLGPACDDPATLARLIRAGADVARLNFSHGEAAEHEQRVGRLRRAASEAGRLVALLADLQGPRFRVGRLPQGSVELSTGEEVVLLAGADRAPAGEIPVSYAALADEAQRGTTIFIDDGKIELRVTSKRGERLRCEVVRGGAVSDRKGINVPDVKLAVPSLTDKDRRDLEQAVSLGADWLAVSFVREPADVRHARALLERAGRALPVMAKIERREAVERLEEIVEEADGLLIARGDLGVELPPEDVPVLQKQMIELANRAGKPVMTATQMLESMRHSRRPTRAEASDVANAVLDGSDCLLLTAETAVGDWPVEAVEMMARIIERAEASGRAPRIAAPAGEMRVSPATCLAGCRAAYEVGAKALVVFTESGFSALQTSRFRPGRPILAFAASEEVARRLQLVWGVEPRSARRRQSIDGMIRAMDAALLEAGDVEDGDRVVVLAGSLMGVTGTTNLMEIHRVRVGEAEPRSPRR